MKYICDHAKLDCGECIHGLSHTPRSIEDGMCCSDRGECDENVFVQCIPTGEEYVKTDSNK